MAAVYENRKKDLTPKINVSQNKFKPTITKKAG